MKKNVMLVFILTMTTLTASAQNFTHLTVNNSTYRDVANHPAFKGFGERMLDRDDNTGDYNRRLTDPVIVNAVNHMIDEVRNGRTIFYDFYTPQQKRSDPAKENTGLFFFKGNPCAPFAVMCPGGAWAFVGSLRGGFPIAFEINKKGYNVFVIRYRIGGEQRACEDLAAALTFIFSNTRTFEISTQNYSLWGESAGARMAARLSSHGTVAYGANVNPKPVAAIILYTAHQDFTNNDPPTFTVAGGLDRIAPPATMERRVNAMRAADIPVEYYNFPNAPHGFGLGVGTSAEGWVNNAVQFWERYIIRDRIQ